MVFLPFVTTFSMVRFAGVPNSRRNRGTGSGLRIGRKDAHSTLVSIFQSSDPIVYFLPAAKQRRSMDHNMIANTLSAATTAAAVAWVTTAGATGNDDRDCDMFNNQHEPQRPYYAPRRKLVYSGNLLCIPEHFVTDQSVYWFQNFVHQKLN